MIFLVEFGVHDGVSPSSLYLATAGYTSRPSDDPPNQYYMWRLNSAGSIETAMFSGGDGVSGGTTSGSSRSGAGTIVALNGTPYGGSELIDDWLGLAFSTVTILSVDNAAQSLAQSTIRFVGTVDQLVSTRALDQFDVQIRDRLSDLDKPLLTSKYLGTTTAAGLGVEGEADLKDKIKPKIWGTVHNAPCVPVNIYELIYQVSDGPVNSIAVYDGGLSLTSAGDFGSLLSLTSASLIPGQYGTCLALGLFRLGGQAFGLVTADVVEGASPALRSAGQIASRMLAWLQANYPATLVSFASGTITALDALNTAECGVLVQETETALSAIGHVLNSVGAWILPAMDSASDFRVGRLQEPAGTAVATFDIEDCIGGSPDMVGTGDEGRGIPAYKVIVRYDRLGVTQGGDQLFGAVAEDRKGYLAAEWRQESAENAALLTQYPTAPTITIDSALVGQATAQAEAARQLALRSVQRIIFRMRVPFADAQSCLIGSVVELVSHRERFGLGDSAGFGRKHVVIGRVDEFSEDAVVTLDLWGAASG